MGGGERGNARSVFPGLGCQGAERDGAGPVGRYLRRTFVCGRKAQVHTFECKHEEEAAF